MTIEETRGNIKFVICLSLSLLLQFLLCLGIGRLSSGKEIAAPKELRIRLMQEETIVDNNVLSEANIKEDISVPELLQQELPKEPMDTLLDDPFSKPLVMEVPIIPVEPKKTEEKIVEKLLEKPLEKPLEKILTLSEPIISENSIKPDDTPKAKSETKPNLPVLSKSQLSENQKYLGKVMKIFEKNRVYPSEARKRHIEGQIMVSFTIDMNGKIGNLSIKTPEPKILAKATENLINKSKLPSPPSHWQASTLIQLPIEYKLR